MASLDEASRCPKCKAPGEHFETQSGDRGSKVMLFKCPNERCTWHGTSWIVQVLADGSIPERKKGPKQYDQLTRDQEAFARRYLEQAAIEGGIEVPEHVRQDPAFLEELRRRHEN